MRESRERQIKRKTVYQGRILDLYVDRVRTADGRGHVREVVGHRPAVAIVPITKDHKVVLIRQYRHAVRQLLWEIPAGLIDPGETPLRAAKRELLEETGCRPKQMKKLVSLYSSPGFSEEIVHLFIAREVQKVSAQALDHDEYLTVSTVAIHTALRWIEQRKLRDGKSILGLVLAAKMMKI